jgi:hypothetical protein
VVLSGWAFLRVQGTFVHNFIAAVQDNITCSESRDQQNLVWWKDKVDGDGSGCANKTVCTGLQSGRWIHHSLRPRILETFDGRLALQLIILGLEKIHPHFTFLVRELPEVVDDRHVLAVQAHAQVKYDEEKAKKYPKDNVEFLPSLRAHFLQANKVSNVLATPNFGTALFKPPRGPLHTWFHVLCHSRQTAFSKTDKVWSKWTKLGRKIWKSHVISYIQHPTHLRH